MPPEAKIAVFEDDDITREMIRDDLEFHHHKVVLEVSTMPEAETAIPPLGELEIQVAVIDGNLSAGERMGFEGRFINNQIKVLFPDIKTVGHSLDSVVEGTDVSIEKYSSSLGQVITEL